MHWRGPRSESRKEHKPENSATDMAAVMGIELLTEQQYRELRFRLSHALLILFHLFGGKILRFSDLGRVGDVSARK